MKLDFEILFWPEKYHKLADATFRLPQKVTDETKKAADIDDNIPASCIAGNINEPNTVLTECKDKVGPLPTTEELIEAQANNLLCRNLK